MPVYDYKCIDHGIFSELATVDEAHLPCACPECGVLAARVIMLSPQLLAMDKDTRQAMETNERSRHEPVVSSEDQRHHDAHHRSQCGCQDVATSSTLMYTADGSKMFPSARPWMISH